LERHNHIRPSRVLGRGEQPELLPSAVLDAASDCVLVLDCDLKVRLANLSSYSMFRSGPQETVSKHVYELGNGQLGLPELRILIENTPLEPGRSHSVEVEHLFPELGYKALRVTARRLRLIWPRRDFSLRGATSVRIDEAWALRPHPDNSCDYLSPERADRPTENRVRLPRPQQIPLCVTLG
jgi:hypothetical protein